MKKKVIAISLLLVIGSLVFFATSCKKDKEDKIKAGPDVTDIDGNVYHSVIIGSQTWMTENLKVTHFLNGEPIPNITDSVTWCDLSTGSAYCDYYNDANNSTVYGRLYNMHAIYDQKRIAPNGWHVAMYSDWNELINYLGGDQVAGGKLKEQGTSHWNSPNAGATNETGFSALPGGMRSSGSFIEVKSVARWWCEGTVMSIFYNSTDGHIFNGEFEFTEGMSVRCVKD
jgi:uncharacterized protein (TIGR02145 family)